MPKYLAPGTKKVSKETAKRFMINHFSGLYYYAIWLKKLLPYHMPTLKNQKYLRPESWATKSHFSGF